MTDTNPYWNTLGNIETPFDELVKVVDMTLISGDMICYTCEYIDSTESNPVYGYRKLRPEDLKEFKEWLSQNHK